MQLILIYNYKFRHNTLYFNVQGQFTGIIFNTRYRINYTFNTTSINFMINKSFMLICFTSRSDQLDNKRTNSKQIAVDGDGKNIHADFNTSYLNIKYYIRFVDNIGKNYYQIANYHRICIASNLIFMYWYCQLQHQALIWQFLTARIIVWFVIEVHQISESLFIASESQGNLVASVASRICFWLFCLWHFMSWYGSTSAEWFVQYMWLFDSIHNDHNPICEN